MAKVDGSLGSLVQGVSQQPSRARLPGQSEEQINVTNDEVFGMSRRSGTTIITTVDKFPPDTSGDTDMEHGTLRMGGKTMSYMLRCGDEPKMSVIDGATTYPVHMDTAALRYMKTRVNDNPYGRRVLLKEMDNKVFVTNTQALVEMDPDLPTGMVKDAGVVLCRGGKYAVGYRIDLTIGSVTHSVGYCTPNGASANQAPYAQVAYIMDILHKLLTNPVTSTAATSMPAGKWVPSPGVQYTTTPTASEVWFRANFTIEFIGNHLIIRPKVAGLDYKITAYETSNSDLLVATQSEVKTVGFLPTRAPLGMVTRVVGSLRKEDDYFLRWTVEGRSTLGTTYDEDGIWEECTAPDEPYMLNDATMPHALSWDAANTRYEIKSLLWAHRRAGNNDSNPLPKFVGQSIQDMVDFQGRAVFLHSDNVTMAATDAYTTVFNQTATTKLATDPINLKSTSTDGESKLIYAIPFNRDLVIFGTNQVQFMISGRRTITGDTASIVLTSEFEADLTARPQAVGTSIMFLSYTGKYTHVHEMFLSGTQNNHERRTVTDHVPRYIEGRASVFSANDGANTAAIVGKDKRTVCLYEFMWIDDRRVQSAWSKWNFNADVVHLSINEGVANVTVRTATGGIVKTALKLYREDTEGVAFPVCVDMQQTKTLADTDTLTATTSGLDPEKVIVVAVDGAVPGSRLLTTSVVPVAGPNSPNQVTVTLRKKHTGKVIVGERFNTRLIPTMPVLRDRDGVAVTQAKLTITDFHLTFEGTGPFKMTRMSSYEAPADYWTTTYTGRSLGDPDFKIGTAPIDSDTIDFPFSDLTTASKLVVESDTQYPMTLTEIEWTGNINNRSRRLVNGG